MPLKDGIKEMHVLKLSLKQSLTQIRKGHCSNKRTLLSLRQE